MVLSELVRLPWNMLVILLTNMVMICESPMARRSAFTASPNFCFSFAVQFAQDVFTISRMSSKKFRKVKILSLSLTFLFFLLKLCPVFSRGTGLYTIRSHHWHFYVARPATKLIRKIIREVQRLRLPSKSSYWGLIITFGSIEI